GGTVDQRAGDVDVRRLDRDARRDVHAVERGAGLGDVAVAGVWLQRDSGRLVAGGLRRREGAGRRRRWRGGGRGGGGLGRRGGGGLGRRRGRLGRRRRRLGRRGGGRIDVARRPVTDERHVSGDHVDVVVHTAEHGLGREPDRRRVLVERVAARRTRRQGG